MTAELLSSIQYTKRQASVQKFASAQKVWPLRKRTSDPANQFRRVDGYVSVSVIVDDMQMEWY